MSFDYIETKGLTDPDFSWQLVGESREELTLEEIFKMRLKCVALDAEHIGFSGGEFNKLVFEQVRTDFIDVSEAAIQDLVISGSDIGEIDIGGAEIGTLYVDEPANYSIYSDADTVVWNVSERLTGRPASNYTIDELGLQQRHTFAGYDIGVDVPVLTDDYYSAGFM